MEFDHRSRRATTSSAAGGYETAPGKRTLTEGLAVQRRDDDAGHTAAPSTAPARAADEGARPTLHMLFGVQRAATAAAPEDAAQVHAAAAHGTATPATRLPYAEQIQRAFGRHNISGIQAHAGLGAVASARAMGAQAYATGNHVVLGDRTDLHTVAHEAAHVVQQRAGVQLAGGVGQAEDRYERHADAVADLVVQGKSAEGALDEFAEGMGSRGHGGQGKAPGNGASSSADTQRQSVGAAVQRRLPSDLVQRDTDIIANLPKLKKLFTHMYQEQRIAHTTITKINMDLTFRGIDGLHPAYPDKAIGPMIANDQNPPSAWVDAIKTLIKEQPAVLYSNPAEATAAIKPTDQARLLAAYTAANTLFDEIAAGTHDVSLGQIFGGSVAGAKTRFANAKAKLTLRYGAIDTDYHGDDTEIDVGGYARADHPMVPGKIHLAASFFSGSLENATIVLVHESAHLGNSDVLDKGYDRSPGYDVMQEADKLTNADHYAEVMRRKLGVSAYPGAVFQPANLGGGGGGVVQTHFQLAARAASEDARMAWTVGVRILDWLRGLHAYGDLHVSAMGLAYNLVPVVNLQEYQAYKWVKFWSNVMGLTFHKRNTDVDKVSMQDLALAEAVTRKLAGAKNVCPAQCAVNDVGLTLLEKTDVNALKKHNIAKTLTSILGIRATPARDMAMFEIMVSRYGTEFDVATMLSNSPAKLPK